MRRLLTMQLFEGPPIQRAELSARRAEQRELWINAISTIQSKLPRGYESPAYLRQLHRCFADRRYPSVPEAQVYLQDLLELQQREFSRMVLTWFGARWPGNPLVIGAEVLREESGKPRRSLDGRRGR